MTGPLQLRGEPEGRTTPAHVAGVRDTGIAPASPLLPGRPGEAAWAFAVAEQLSLFEEEGER